MVGVAYKRGTEASLSVASRMWTLRSRFSYADVQILCPGPFSPRLMIPAHKIVLAANSEHCREMFDFLDAQGAGEGVRGGPLVLTVPVASPDVVKSVLEFVYTGEASWEEDQLEAVLKVADFLRISDLKDATEAAIHGLTGDGSQVQMESEAGTDQASYSCCFCCVVTYVFHMLIFF